MPKYLSNHSKRDKNHSDGGRIPIDSVGQNQEQTQRIEDDNAKRAKNKKDFIEMWKAEVKAKDEAAFKEKNEWN